MDILNAIKFNDFDAFQKQLKTNQHSGQTLIEHLLRYERLDFLKSLQNFYYSGQYDKRGYKKNDTACANLANAFENISEILLKTEKYNLINQLIILNLTNPGQLLLTALKSLNHSAIEFLLNNFHYPLNLLIEEVFPTILKKEDKKSFINILNYLQSQHLVYLNLNNNPALYQAFIHKDKFYFETILSNLPYLEITSIYFKEKNANYFDIVPAILRNTHTRPLPHDYYLQHLFGGDLRTASAEKVLYCFDNLVAHEIITYPEIINGLKSNFSKHNLDEYQYYLDTIEAKIEMINMEKNSLDEYSQN